jgi:Mg/Co/Ni transporter MgtE
VADPEDEVKPETYSGRLRMKSVFASVVVHFRSRRSWLFMAVWAICFTCNRVYYHDTSVISALLMALMLGVLTSVLGIIAARVAFLAIERNLWK